MARLMDLQVNGSTHELTVDPQRSLLSVLRDDLDLTGTKYACGESLCGACTVLVDGRPVRSCVYQVGGAVGKEIRTIEGLAAQDRLHPVQEAFLEAGAMQCGFCTSGMVMSAVGLLERQPDPSDREIVEFMRGNVCRCGTYPRVVEAIRNAAAATRGGGR